MIRRTGSKPAVALWMLIAIADVALLVAAGPTVVLTVLAGLAVLAAAVIGAIVLQRRTAAATTRTAPLRRRA